MSNEILKRDENRVTVLGGVTDDSSQFVTMLRVDPSTKRLLISAVSGGSGQVITPTGTVNGVNTTFTVPAGTIITSITVDGLVRYSGFGYTYSDPTITVDPLAPPVEYIRVTTASVTSAGQVNSIVAGTNVTVDSSDPRNPIMNATGGGGSGTVDTVQGGNGVSVDSSNPANPIVSADINPTTGQYKTYLTVGFSNADYTCDGTNDDVQIQQAIDALPSTGGIVFVKGSSTVYDIGATVIIDAYQTILGAGTGATTFKAKNSLNAYVFSTATTASASWRKIYMAHFKIDGNRGGNTSGGGIYCHNSRNSTFYDLWVTESDDYAINLDGDSALGWFNQVDRCEVDLCDAGFHSRFCEHNWFSHNTMSFVIGKGIFCESDLDLIEWNQLDFIEDYEIHCYFGAGIWKVMNNSIDRPQSDGVVIEGAVKCDVSHNYFDSAPADRKSVV